MDAVEVEHHQLRVLQLKDVGVASGPGDRLDPERRLGARRVRVAGAGSLSGVQERRVGGPAAPSDDAVGGGDVQEVAALHRRPLQCGLKRLLEDAVGVLDHGLGDAG